MPGGGLFLRLQKEISYLRDVRVSQKENSESVALIT